MLQGLISQGNLPRGRSKSTPSPVVVAGPSQPRLVKTAEIPGQFQVLGGLTSVLMAPFAAFWLHGFCCCHSF